MSKAQRHYCICISWNDAMAAASAFLCSKLEDVSCIKDPDRSRWLVCGRGVPEYKLIAARIDD